MKNGALDLRMNVDGMDVLACSMDSGVFFLAFDVVSGFIGRQPCNNECLHCDGVLHNQGLDLEERWPAGSRSPYVFALLLSNRLPMRLRLRSSLVGLLDSELIHLLLKD